MAERISSSDQATLVQPLIAVNADVGHTALADTSFEARYSMGAVLGRGGMGEVRMCADHRIGRDVAYKAIRHEAVEGLEERFLREVRVQGQLEHPSIVPVYDLGVAPDGSLYFTMKRVRGLTLDAILRGLRASDSSLEERFSLRRLLVAFNQVCLAVDYAHQHSVLHRDLKPENIMLGDFGEVYVLDWGLSKIVDGGPSQTAKLQTARGAVMGTPGYMAPEQIVAAEDIDARSDVFALGAVLFEILTREPLLAAPQGKTQLIYKATLAGPDARASRRAPHREIPPELDAICVRATQRDPGNRYATAREMSNALERYLDGERDVATRQRLATDHAEAAKKLVRAGNLDLQKRAAILAEVGRALALDPNHRAAREVFTNLMSTPIAQLPRSVGTEFVAGENERLKFARQGGTIGYAAWVLLLPVMIWMGVRDWAALTAMLLAAMLSALLVATVRPGKSYTYVFYGVIATSTVAIVFTSRLFGPFVLLPSIATANVLGLCLVRPRRAAPWPLLASLGCVAVLLPIVLELFGVLAPSYRFEAGGFFVVPHMLDLPPSGTLLVLVFASLTMICAPAAILSRIVNSLDRVELELRLQAWHYERLISGSRPGSEYPPPLA